MNAVGKIPPNFQLLFDPEAIAAAVARVGLQVDAWAAEVWENSHTDILAIPVLMGGVFFFADLVRTIEHSIEIAPARTWAYDKEAFKQRPQVNVNISEVPAKGRAVLLVDDICDSGRTLHSISQALVAAGARVVKSAVLIRRALPDQAFSPDWVGLEFSGHDWLVGYGMDDGHRWRNLSGLYTITQK